MTQVIVNGLYLGAQYALIALGLTLIFALMNVLNFAHGQMYVFGGFITEIWSGLNDAGLPEVMLYLPDGAAYRCHWDDTATVGEVRVALLADQDRKIVRIVPVHQCQGIGIASPKGTDPAGYRAVVQAKLNEKFQGDRGRQGPES